MTGLKKCYLPTPFQETILSNYNTINIIIFFKTGELQPNSALNLIVFGKKREHLDLIEFVIVDLLRVKYNSFIKKVRFKRENIHTTFTYFIYYMNEKQNSVFNFKSTFYSLILYSYVQKYFCCCLILTVLNCALKISF